MRILKDRTSVKCRLEVDHERGVMYVHLTEPRDIEQYQRVTVLRISGTPKPIPSFEEGLLDIGLSTDGWTTSWNGKDGHLAPEYDERIEGTQQGGRHQ